MMQTVFKLAYSLAVAILFVLFMILGTQTFYAEPEAPPYPPSRSIPPPFDSTPRPVEQLYCERDGRCFSEGSEVTAEDEAKLTEEERLYLQEQRQLQERQQEYLDDRADYNRNVFILASALGVAAIAAGLYLFRRVEALPLGLVLGGLGVVIYGWVKAAEDFDEIGTAPMFVVVVGLAIVLAGGYWFLGSREIAEGNGES